MELLELSLATAAENVALDEALLEAAEGGERSAELLRLWELARPAVVLGRSSRASEEVDLEECRRLGIEVVRRSSGGAAIVAGPGCLMYSLVLSYQARPELRFLDHAHQFVLGRLARALGTQLPAVEHCGISDLAIGGRKVSGNSLRCKRDWLLYHGTLLYQMDLSTIGRLLRPAPRQPAYRQGRDHDAFVTNAPLTRQKLVQSVKDAFAARLVTSQWPPAAVARLVRERYGEVEWTLQR
jgi:lipoate-protein ligase A